MIKAAKKQWNKSKNVAYLKDSTAELLPFPDKTFDNLVCFATFDATIQNRSINEFIRVVRPGGRIYLTGKNNGFKKNDINAILAESAARKKKHPNNFTDTKRLLNLLNSKGHRIIKSYFFLRRGDMSSVKFTNLEPKNFYEYFIIFERGKNKSKLPIFHSNSSSNYKK